MYSTLVVFSLIGICLVVSAVSTFQSGHWVIGLLLGFIGLVLVVYGWGGASAMSVERHGVEPRWGLKTVFGYEDKSSHGSRNLSVSSENLMRGRSAMKVITAITRTVFRSGCAMFVAGFALLAAVRKEYYDPDLEAGSISDPVLALGIALVIVSALWPLIRLAATKVRRSGFFGRNEQSTD